MIKQPATLPPRFESLSPYLDWALPTETMRRRKREASNMEEIRGFYDAVLPHTSDIMEHLRQAGPRSQADAPTLTLYTLMLAFSDASLSVELHKSPIVPDGMPGEIWKPEHETPGWQNKPAAVLQPRQDAA